jgi:hypothetical protein
MQTASFNGKWSVVFNEIKNTENGAKLSEIQPKHCLRLKLVQFCQGNVSDGESAQV